MKKNDGGDSILYAGMNRSCGHDKILCLKNNYNLLKSKRIPEACDVMRGACMFIRVIKKEKPLTFQQTAFKLWRRFNSYRKLAIFLL